MNKIISLRKLIVLDVDHTFLYLNLKRKRVARKHDGHYLGFKYYIRPYFKMFVDDMTKDGWEFATWTSAPKIFYKALVKKAVKKFFKPKFSWFYEQGTKLKGLPRVEMLRIPGIAKDLRKIKGYDRVIIIDDSPHKTQLNKLNAINIKRWSGEKYDNAFLKILLDMKEA